MRYDQNGIVNGHLHKIFYTLSFFYSEKRDELFDFTQTIFEVPASIFVRTDRPDIAKLADLSGKKIAMQRGDYAAEYLKSQGITAEIVPTSTFAEATNMVINGQADAIIGDEQIVLYHLYRSNLNLELKIIGEPLYIGLNSMAVLQGHHLLQSIINKGIEHADASGMLDRLSRKWIGTTLPDHATESITLWPYILVACGGIALVALWNLSLRHTITRQTTQIKKNQQRLTYIIEGSQAGTWEWNVQTGRTVYNERWAEMLGYSLPELSPLDITLWQRLSHPDDLVKAENALEQHFAGEIDSYRCEVRMRHKDGHWVWVLDRGRVYEWDADGAPLLMAGTHLDITDLKQAEAGYQLLFQSMLNGFALHEIVCDSAGNPIDYRFLAVNPSFEQMTGLRAHDIVGRTVLEVLPNTEPYWIETYGKVALGGEPIFFENYSREIGKHFQITAFSPSPHRFACVFADITERKRAEDALQASEKKFREVTELLPQTVFESNLQGILTYVNQAGYKAFGYTEADLVRGMNITATIIPEDHARLAENLKHITLTGIAKGNSYTALRKDGSTFPIQVYTSVCYEHGKPTGFRGVLIDMTELALAETELRIAAAAFESQEGMVVTDANGVILKVNTSFTETTGYQPEEVIGQNPRILQSGYHDEKFYRDMWESINASGVWQGEIWDQRKNGEVYPKWLTISAVKNAAGRVTHYVGSHFDITERKRAEERIAELAYFDQLTGLPNRTLFNDRLKQAMTAAGRRGVYGALFFIDLDNFKTLNDTLGHDMGDSLLRQVAQRLTSCVRGEDTVARLGGDEFLVMISSLHSDKTEAAQIAETIGEKILTTLNQPYTLAGLLHHSTQSIGVTLFLGEDTSIDEMMKQADLAMYKAKASGRDAIRFFDPAMEIAVTYRTALEKDLRNAIREGQLILHYQAQIGENGTVTGAEALVRWQHPTRGMVSPADFIPLAEETGLILSLGQWVLETACTNLACWASEPKLADLTLAINVSTRQFRELNFVATVLDSVQKTGANPALLKLELTESLLVEKVDDVVDKMATLKTHGIGFSLDDFGTGYSSLAYLKRLPLDQLKIDQSFVRDVLDDPNDATIAKTVVALGKSFGLSVIAEGVETEAQREFLASVGCYACQGYLFSRPLPIEQFEAYVKNNF